MTGPGFALWEYLRKVHMELDGDILPTGAFEGGGGCRIVIRQELLAARRLLDRKPEGALEVGGGCRIGIR